MKQQYWEILQWVYRYARRGILWLFSKWDSIVVIVLTFYILTALEWYSPRRSTQEEAAARSKVVATALQYLGFNEADGTHRQIVDRYNAHEPRARDYEVTYADSWCAVFTSSVALEADMLGTIPLECSCEQQILLFDAQGDWVEEDCYLPKPGDFIYYDWNSTGDGNCKGWSDHVGIVVQTFGPVIKVIEGNKNDDVSYRYIFINDPFIRGFGTPDY